MTQKATRTVTYTLTSRTSGVAGLQKFEDSLKRILDVQNRLAAQGDVTASLRTQTQAAVQAAQQEAQAARSAAQAKRQAGNEYASWWRASLREQDTAEKRAHSEGMQRLRDRAATMKLNAQLSAQAEREAQQVVRAAMQERKDLLAGVQLAYARARAEFDKSAGESRNWGDKSKAIQTYKASVREATEALLTMGKTGDWTAQELKQVENLKGRMARELNTIGGGVNLGGLSGNISNAMDASLPRWITGLQNSMSSLSPILNGLSPSLGAAALNTTQLAEAFAGAGQGATVMGGAATVAGAAVAGAGALIVAAGVGISSSVNAYADLEKALNGLKASSGANAGEMKQLRGEAENVGRQFGFLTRDVVAVQEELSKGGVSVQDIAGGAATAVAVLAKATGVDFKQAVDIAVPVMNVWSLSGAQMMQVADAISNGANKSALDVAGLAQSLQQSANSAQASGLTLNETVAVLAALADRGMQGSDAGTSLKVMLQRLQAPTKDATAELQKHGVAVFDASGKQRGMIDVLGDVMTALDGMTDKQRSAFLVTVFGSDATRAITSAWKTGRGTLREYIAAVGEQGTALKNAETRTEGIRGAQDRWNSALDTFKTNVGQFFAPAMTTIIDMGTQALNVFTALTKAMTEAFQGTSVTDATLSGRQAALDGLLARKQRLQADAAQSRAAGWMTAQGEQELTKQLAALDKAIQDLRKQVKDAQTQAIQKGQAALPAGVQGPQFGGVQTPAYSTTVGGRDLVTLLGMGGRRSGTPYDQTYGPNGSWGRHNGEDYFAKTGSALLAPFTGTVRTRWSDTTGNIVEMIDAEGKKLVLGHLDAFANGLQAAIKAAGKKGLVVQAGQVLGTVGQTGSLAHKDLGPGNAHVHVMAYLPDGTIVDPKTVKFVPLSESLAVTATKGTYGTSTNTSRPGGQASDQALIAEARRILGKLDDYQKAGNLTGVTQAEAVLKAFEKSSPRAAAALDYVRSKTKEASKATSEWGQQFDKFKAQLEQGEALHKLNDNTKAYLTTLDSVTRSAQAAATAEKGKNGETAKYRALLDLAGDAAGKARQLRDADQRTAEQDEKEAKRRAKEQAQLRAQVADQARQLTVQAAQDALNRTKELNSQELAAFRGNSAQRIALVERQARDEEAARLRVAAAVRDKAKADNAIGPQQNRKGLDAAADRAYQQAELEAQGARTSAVQQAKDKEGQAVRSLRDQYRQLADSIRSQVAAGEFDENARRDALKSFNALSAAAKAAGLYENEHATAARRSAYALIDQGVATATLIRASGERIAQIKEQADLEAQQAEDAQVTVPALTGMLSELIAQDLNPRDTGYVKLLDELIAKGGQAGKAAQYVRDNLLDLEVDLGSQAPEAIQARGARALAAARAANDPELPDAENVTLEQSQARTLAARVIDEAFNQPQTIGGKLTAALRAVLSDSFSDLSDAGREAFWGRFEELANDPEVGDVGASLARFLLGRMTDAPEFDTLRSKLIARLDLEAQDNSNRATSAIDAANTLADKDVDAALTLLEQTLSDLWDAAGRGEDAADGIDRVTEAINRLTEARQTGEQAGLDDLLSNGNTRAGADAVKAADDLAGQGQYTEALDLLEQTLSDLYDAAADGQDAADAINEVTDAINRLTKARDAANAKDTAEATVKTADVLSKLADSQRELNTEMGHSEAPYAAQIRALEALKKEAPGLAQEIDLLIEKWQKLQGTTQAKQGFDKMLNTAKSIANAVSQVGGVLDEITGSDTKGPLNILGDWMQMNVTALEQWTKGDYVGAIMTTVQGIMNIGESIANLNPKLREWKKLQAEIAADQRQAAGSKKLNGWLDNPYYADLNADAQAREQMANSKWYQRAWWGLTGSGPKTMDESLAKLKIKAAEIFSQFGGDLANTFEESLMEGFDQGDFSKVNDKLDGMINKFVARMTVQMVLANSKLKDLIKSYADARAAGGDGSAELAAIRQEVEAVTGIAQGALSGLDGFGAGAQDGSGTPADTSSPVTGANFYVANSSKIDLFDGAVTRWDAITLRHGTSLDRHSTSIDRHSDMLDRLARDGITIRTPQGDYAGAIR